jgi:diguanylate cyclase (GGDEF)-like protein/PAS domain S-box-containing protein
MRWEINPYSLSLLFTAAISAVFAVYTWRRRATPGAFPFVFFLLAAMVLSLGYAFEYQTDNLDVKLFWSQVEYIGIVCVPVAWLLFSMQYTGHNPVRMRRLTFSLLLIPALTLLLVWTNKYHNLIWTRTEIAYYGNIRVLDLDYGAWFWIHTGYSYLLVAIGMTFLVRFYLHAKGVYRKQAGIVLLGMFIPWISNILYIAQVERLPYDLSPFAFAIAGLFATWSFLRLQFLDILPLARDAILDRMQDGVIVLDARNRILDINPAAQSLLRKSLAQVIGRQADQVFADYSEMVQRYINVESTQAILTGGSEEAPQYWDLSISPLYDSRGTFTGRLIVLHDVTERQVTRLALQNTNVELERRVQERTAELEAANEKLRASALHDPLTGLPNRRLLIDRLERVIKRTRRHPDQTAAVLFMDIDNFKSINDSLGHTRGDAFLKTIADRLKTNMRAGDTVARHGGDEFVFLLEDIRLVDDAVLIAERLLNDVSRPIELDGHEVFTNASIGIALVSARYQLPEQVLGDADLAMYRAKAKGKGRCEIYNPELRTPVQHQLQLQDDIAQAMDRGEFQLYYQPVVDLRSREVVSVEALLRWQHPEHGLLYPRQFLRQVEETSWIKPLGEWILRTACAQLGRWLNNGFEGLRVTVNISNRQFFELDLLDLVPKILDETSLPPQSLELEISESTVRKDIDRAIELLTGLSQIGVQISIDNFGEGRTSLSHLDSLPANSVKIDRSFGFELMDHTYGVPVAAKIIAAAHERRLNVVGKRVETRQQLAFLASQDYDQVQGYLVSEAVPPDLAAELFGSGAVIPSEALR